MRDCFHFFFSRNSCICECDSSGVNFIYCCTLNSSFVSFYFFFFFLLPLSFDTAQGSPWEDFPILWGPQVSQNSPYLILSTLLTNYPLPARGKDGVYCFTGLRWGLERIQQRKVLLETVSLAYTCTTLSMRTFINQQYLHHTNNQHIP